MANANASGVPNFFGMIFARSKNRAEVAGKYAKFCQNLLTQFSPDFGCNLKNGVYNVDIRSKKERKKERKKMKNMKMKIVQRIIDLRWEMDDYRSARMYGKVAEIRLEIARLEALLSETY
jgi:hypothetical protein